VRTVGAALVVLGAVIVIRCLPPWFWWLALGAVLVGIGLLLACPGTRLRR